MNFIVYKRKCGLKLKNKIIEFGNISYHLHTTHTL